MLAYQRNMDNLSGKSKSVEEHKGFSRSVLDKINKLPIKKKSEIMKGNTRAENKK